MSISGIPPKPPSDPAEFGPDLKDPKLEAPTKVKVNRQTTTKFGDKVQTFDKMVEYDITNMRSKADSEKPSF